MPAYDYGLGIPAWLKPENASVFDAAWKAPVRSIVSWLGLDDPQQVMGLGVPLETGPMTGGALEAIGSRFPKLTKVIKAFHGSPHDFEKFSMEKIGTGEGAQAYGHGLYFAESEGTAKSYRDALQQSTVEIMGQSHPIPSWSGNLSPQPRLIRRLADARAVQPEATESDVIDRVRKNIEFELRGQYVDDASRNHLQSQLDILSAAEQRGIKTSSGGRMYEVNIHADPDQLLDWDKPIQDQPESIRYILGYRGRPAESEVSAVFAKAKKLGVDASTLPEYRALEQRMDAAAKLEQEYPTGRHIYQQLANDQRDVAIRQGRNQATTLPASESAASAELRSLGVPGLKYLDQGSRSAGEGTKNFVIWDDKLIEIARKYGWAAASAEVLRRQQQKAEQ